MEIPFQMWKVILNYKLNKIIKNMETNKTPF
jgi:hypothetical protein